jgi:hypothetical protein
MPIPSATTGARAFRYVGSKHCLPVGAICGTIQACATWLYHGRIILPCHAHAYSTRSAANQSVTGPAKSAFASLLPSVHCFRPSPICHAGIVCLHTS